MDIKEGTGKLQDATDHLKSELAKIRAGSASPDMIASIEIDAYESKMPLEHVATISVPDPKSIVIKPWDSGNLEPIEKAILASDVGLTPVVDGEIVRLNIPALTQERREEFVKEMKEKVEDIKVSIRSIRHQMMDDVDEMAEGGGISEDDVDRRKDEVEKVIKEFMEEVEKIAEEKEKELKSL